MHSSYRGTRLKILSRFKWALDRQLGVCTIFHSSNKNNLEYVLCRCSNTWDVAYSTSHEKVKKARRE